ncbi:MAG: hypothetical protein Unbinned6486contig1001_43 [Prokaryotic dsDNA virus sp.]|nr:MAG: hypothetical protein Unbinned6486contig1001_43 [Prokaryotic dsDNA virus sp.]|tara:strand:+ start:11158 stop:11679 length:522 start_codon:yes stop_codon:yes gene_type:complete
MKKYSVVEILYKDYDKLVRFAVSLLKNKSLAEDVVQDVFLQLISSNSNHLVWIYGNGKGLSYLNKIIAVRCLSKKSKFYKEQILYQKNKLPTSESELEYLYNKTNLEQTIVDKKLLKKIHLIVNTFDEYEKNLFLLYYESEMTYKELSEEIGIPKISIYNTVRKVTKKIKELI